VAVVLAIYAVTTTGKLAQWSLARLSALGAVGAAAIWLSHPSVFVLAGIGITGVVMLAREKQWAALARFIVVGFFWLGSLSVSYFFFLRNLTRDQALLDYWTGNFMPLPPKSVSDFKWFLDTFFGFFSQTVSFQMVGLAALTFIVGAASMYVRDREKLSFLLLPALLTLLASGLHKYPFGGRIVLFLVPAVLLLIAEGAEEVRLATGRNVLIGCCLLILLFLEPSLYLLHHLAKPNTVVLRSGVMFPEEIKPVIAYIRTHQENGDLVYLSTGSQPAYQYYEELAGVHANNIVPGTAMGEDAGAYLADLDRLRGRRVWVVLSHINGGGATQSRYIEFYLNTIGTKIDSFTSAGAVLDLYDMRPASSSSSHTSSQP
jgi:hypothetical protein